MKTYRFLLAVTVSALFCAIGRTEDNTAEPDPVLVKFKSKIEQQLGTLDPKPSYEVPESSLGRSLVVRYNTRQYVIHPRNKAGRIAENTVMREGPGDDGFLLRAHIQPFGEVNQACVPQTIRQTYWSLFLQVYEIEKEKKQIYFALSYNSRTDPKLIEKLKEMAEQCGTPYAPKAVPAAKR